MIDPFALLDNSWCSANVDPRRAGSFGQVDSSASTPWWFRKSSDVEAAHTQIQVEG